MARVVVSLIAVMIIYWIARDNLVQGKIPPYLLLGEFFICLYITCYCTDIHTNISEAFLVCFLAEYELTELSDENTNWKYNMYRQSQQQRRQYE